MMLKNNKIIVSLPHFYDNAASNNICESKNVGIGINVKGNNNYKNDLEFKN